MTLNPGDDELAELARTMSRRRADLNPGVASIAGTAAQFRGLLDHNRSDLHTAAELSEASMR